VCQDILVRLMYDVLPVSVYGVQRIVQGVSTSQGMVRVLVCGHHAVFMARLVMDGRLWRDTYRIRRSQMRNRYVQAPYLSPGFSDFGDEHVHTRL
jgi:hypothetical protein